MSPLSLHNVLAWWAQVAVIAMIASLLPRLLRIYHPRTHLNYCYGLLAIWILLPFIQPWQESVVTLDTRTGEPLPASSHLVLAFPASDTGWHGIAFSVMIAGAVLRLCWFLAGLYQIRRYRKTSRSFTYPSSITFAQRLTGQYAEVRISRDVGPVTCGFFRPIVLLPESFLTLENEAQRAIVCHELLHVKRNDWLATIGEEFLAALLWFHPAVWWLLGQTKLAREQVVDSEVIRLTAACDAYIDALLMMAGSPVHCELPAAPSFLRRHDLSQRMRLLLVEAAVSRKRVVLTYAVIIPVVMMTSFVSLVSFPLIAESQIRMPQTPLIEVEASAPPPKSLRSPADGIFKPGSGVLAPKLLHAVDPEYSDAAREARLQGSVMLEGVVETDGTMTITRVARSLDPDLDHNAIYALKQWRFEPGRSGGVPVPVELNVEVNFNLK